MNEINLETHCNVEGCKRVVYARSACRYHYDRQRRNGAEILFPRHGEARHKEPRSPEYNTWQTMKKRATNPKDSAYRGRGITICDRWLKFQNFLADMGRRPSLHYSIDRIDNSKGYEPGNCRWATPVEQARNTRRNRLVKYQGKVRCVSEWAALFGLTHGIVDWRLKHGRTVEAALKTQVGARTRWSQKSKA